MRGGLVRGEEVEEVVEWAAMVLRECGRVEDAERVERVLAAGRRWRQETDGAEIERAEIVIPTLKTEKRKYGESRRVPDYDERFSYQP